MAEGFHDFASAEVLTAANVDDYLLRQTVMRFASAAARDSALSGILTEGLVAYLKDVNQVTMYTGSAWVIAYHIGGWSTYSPTIFQEDGTGLTSTGIATYARQGRLISGNCVLTIATAGSATNGESIIVAMPVAPLDTTSLTQYVGIGTIIDTSGPTSYPVAAINYGGAFRFKRTDTSTLSLVGVDPGFALAASDVISFNFQYEAVS